MNAYELAINLDAESSQMEYGYAVNDSELLSNAATMLRQQAEKINNMEQWEKRYLDTIEQLEKEVEHYKNKAEYLDKRELELLAETKRLEKVNTDLAFRAVYAERTLHVIERHYDQLETFSPSVNNSQDVNNSDENLQNGKA